jgi:hypothetical protein
LKYLLEERFRCFEESKYENVSDKQLEQRFKQMQIVNRCDRIMQGPPTPNHVYHNVIFKTCVCNFYNSNINTLIELEDLFQKHGPNDTIYMENGSTPYINKRLISNKLMQSFKIIRNFINEKQEEARKQEERQRKLNQR